MKTLEASHNWPLYDTCMVELMFSFLVPKQHVLHNPNGLVVDHNRLELFQGMYKIPALTLMQMVHGALSPGLDWFQYSSPDQACQVYYDTEMKFLYRVSSRPPYKVAAYTVCEFRSQWYCAMYSECTTSLFLLSKEA